MATIYDASTGAGNNARAKAARPAPARMSSYHDLPDLYDRPLRRLHPMLAAGMALVGAGALLYGTEAFLPVDYKPSRFIGGYAGAIAEARATGELAAKVNTTQSSN